MGEQFACKMCNTASIASEEHLIMLNAFVMYNNILWFSEFKCFYLFQMSSHNCPSCSTCADPSATPPNAMPLNGTSDCPDSRRAVSCLALDVYKITTSAYMYLDMRAESKSGWSIGCSQLWNAAFWIANWLIILLSFCFALVVDNIIHHFTFCYLLKYYPHNYHLVIIIMF